MNVLLLKKIEELTLYLIEKEHQVQGLQQQLDALQSQITEIKESLKE
jgi:prefoldin subunit 5